jgi:hypothetical protein
MTTKENKQFCCQLNTTLQEIYYEQIMGKRGYALGYYTTCYYFLKDFKKQNQLCPNCLNFTDKLWTLYWEARQKIATNK